MQCSGMRGVSAMVQRGTAAVGANASREHSKQDVIRGRMRRDWPEKPSVPPSMIGMIVSGLGSPSSSNSTRLLIIPFNHLLASTLSNPLMTTLNCVTRSDSK